MMAELKELSIEEVKQEAANAEKQKVAESQVQLIVFRLANEEYAIPIDHIKEVVITPGIAKMPHTPSHIKGVANIRGNIIAIMDLEEKFGLGDHLTPSNSGHHFTLVIESEDFKAGILVKEVPNTLSVGVSSIDNSSNIMQYSRLDENCIEGIVKDGDRLIILIDIFEMMSTDVMDKINKL